MRVLLASQDSKLFHMTGLAESLRRLGAETRVLPFSRYGYITPHFTLVPSTEFLKQILYFRPDLVFTDTYYWDAWFSKLVNCPILVHMRGDFWAEFAYLQYLRARRSLPARFATMWTRFVMERGMDFAHTILPICNWLAGQVKRHRPGKRIRVLYQPIEPEIWKEVDGEEMILAHPAIISVFHFHIMPKVLGFIRFFDVARAMRDINFYVAGSGPYLKYVLSRNPPSNMKFLGQLPYPTGVRAFLRAGDLYVHPSGQDACPLTVMEAELMQKAVIGTDVGGVPEVMADKRLLIRDGDTLEWIRKIRWLLEQPEECETIGAQGRQFIEENFSMRKISKGLFEYMKEVIGE